MGLNSDGLKVAIQRLNEDDIVTNDGQNRKRVNHHKGGAKLKHDWTAIMEEYVVGYVVIDPETGHKIHQYPTLDDLAAKYQVSSSYIKNKSSKESWGLRRETFQTKLREKASSNKFHAFISQSASFDARTLLLLDKLYGLAEAYFDQFEGLEIGRDGNFHVINPGYSEGDEDDKGTPIKVTDLKGIVDILDKAQALVRRTVGEPLFNAQAQQASVADDIFNPSKDGSPPTAAIDGLIKKRESYLKEQEKARAAIKEIETQLNEIDD